MNGRMNDGSYVRLFVRPFTSQQLHSVKAPFTEYRLPIRVSIDKIVSQLSACVKGPQVFLALGNVGVDLELTSIMCLKI